MKQIFMLALMLCISSMASPFLKGQSSIRNPDEIPIIIDIKDEHPSGIPKSPYAVSFQAFYDCATSEIVVTAQNAGTTVSVHVENLISGEQFLRAISGNGVSYIPISGTSGFWQITLNLSDGSVYIGEFTLSY